MRSGKALIVCFAVALLATALCGTTAAAAALFEDGFENAQVGTYPPGDGTIQWTNILWSGPVPSGLGAAVSADRAKTGSQSFRLSSWALSAQTDSVLLTEVPDLLAYEVSVHLSGGTARVGFAKKGSWIIWFWNYFRIDPLSRAVWFHGAPGTAVNVGSFVTGNWCTVRAELDYAATPPTGSVYLYGPDGQLVGSAQGVPIAPKQFSDGTMGDVVLNRFCLDSAAYTWSPNPVYFDDVRLWTPTAGPMQVEIDVRPDSNPNHINLRSGGVLPVAVLSSEGFDATLIDPSSVSLSGAPIAVRGNQGGCLVHQTDVNGDGLLDLLIQVETSLIDPGLFDEEGRAVLTGTMCVTASTRGAGPSFEGRDKVTLVPRGGGRNR